MSKNPDYFIRVLLAGMIISGLLLVGSCSLEAPLAGDAVAEAAVMSGAPDGSSPEGGTRKFIPLSRDAEIGINPNPDEINKTEYPPVPSRSKAAAPFSADTASESIEEEPGLEPASLSASLYAGEYIDEVKTGSIPGAPPMGDIMFAIDLTGSMGQELLNVKNNSIAIMTAVRNVIPDTNFGLVSHMDYVGEHGGEEYGYTDNYGNPVIYGLESQGDYPYNLDLPLTDDLLLVETATNGLSLGGGYDYPESYTRVLYESYADPLIGWRPGAKRILLFWQDFIPHDLDPYLDLSQPSSGPDPGRDEIDGTGDDLNLAVVLQGMKDNGITLIALHSSLSNYTWAPYPDPDGIPTLDYWTKYANITGGTAYQINTNGTVPGGTDIASFVADLILAEISHIDSLSLYAPGFEEWLVDVSPAEYTDIDLTSPWTDDFSIRIQVPEGTAPGLYEFDIILTGDGAEYARQSVSITVISPNEPPVADAGEDQTVEQTYCGGAEVTLDGSGSSDPDGDDLTYSWSWDGGSAFGVNPVINLPLGSTAVTLTVEDDDGETDTDAVEILIQDTTPPELVLDLLNDTLWPPNHKLVKAVIVTATDACDPALTPVISVTHNENPHENKGVGDGNTTPDWIIDQDGTVWIRAERNGTGTDRIYTITASAEDSHGNLIEAEATVTVPHDQGD